ncbi:MAG: hypothetical protein ACLFVU_07635 [Phycisphaerae bacterium]
MRKVTILLSTVTLCGMLIACEGTKTMTAADKQIASARPVLPDYSDAQEAMEIGRRDEFAQMKVLLDLEGQQLDEFNKAVEERAEKLQRHQNSEQHKKLSQLRDELKAAKKAKDDAKVAKLEKQIAPLSEEHAAFMEKIRYEVIDVLTPAQKKAWTGYVLRERLGGRFRKANLTDEQKEKILHTCIRYADEQMFQDGDPLKDDPYLKGIYDLRDGATEVIVAKVMTEKQKEQFEE